MLKFKVGDTVKIDSGKDKGRDGKIEKIFPKENLALIPEVNIFKKHVKAGMVKDSRQGGVYEIPRPLPFGKFLLVCPKCKKVTRVGFKIVGEEKVRFCRKCGKEIDTK